MSEKKSKRYKLYVIKRDGSRVPVRFDEITDRLSALCEMEPELDETINPFEITRDVIERIKDETTTSEIDNFTAEMCANNLNHPDYGVLASRLITSSHHKNMMCQNGILFSDVIEALYKNKDQRGEPSPVISEELYNITNKYKEKINNMIKLERDYLIDFFGYKTLLNSYLLKVNILKTNNENTQQTVVESPQHMFLRVALAIHKENFEKVIETYDLLSQKYFAHATPTLFNAGTRHSQLFSCFLLNMEDSIDGIFKCISDTARISKWAGGIGISISDVRGNNSYIKGTAGKSDGIVPMLKVLNDTARYVNQCFTPNTYIYTKSGPKFIKNVTTSDEVITHDGTFRKVLKVIENTTENKIRQIKTEHSVVPIHCTDVHEIMIIREQSDIRERSDIREPEKNESAKFIPAKEVKPGDFLSIPMSEKFTDVPSLTEDVCRFYGMFLSNGRRINASINANTSTEYIIENLCKDDFRFVNKFLTENNIRVSEFDKILYNETSSYRDNSFVRFFDAEKKFPQFLPLLDNNNNNYNNYNNSIKIHEDFINLPRKKLLFLIRGFCESNTDVFPETEIDSSTNFYAGHTSLSIIHSIRMIFLRLGFLPKTATRKTTNNQDYYMLIVNKNEFSNCLKNPVFKHISKVISNEVVNYSGPVYDLNIQENHNYLTEVGIVHNSGKRLGSFAVYLEPWHIDMYEFLECKLPHGPEERRAKDLFYALWVPDLFMTRVRENKEWSLMCPSKCPGLTETYGIEFEELYTRYEKEGRATKKIKAVDLWERIINSQIETGVPYICYKDAVNRKTNHKNLGTIKSSNLCAEINEYNDTKKYACCVLASLVLSSYVNEPTVEDSEKVPLPDSYFDYQKLYQVVRVVTRNLDTIIDLNYYPTPETKDSNFSERPIGIGVQGLADVFFKLRTAYDSEEASVINRKIFETIYFAALTESCQLAKEKGKYNTYDGSPISQGLLQYDLWTAEDAEKGRKNTLKFSGMWDFEALKKDIEKYGVRNSLVTALMPTASTAQIMGSTEAFEPITSNVYTRRVLAGEYSVFNKYLANDLVRLGLWSKKMKNKLLKYKGSIQKIRSIPQELKNIYKTCWEIKQKVLINLSADRGPFIDQSQSLNLFFEKADYKLLTNAHFYGHMKGLKTGSYYIRSKPAGSSEAFTVDDDGDDDFEDERTEEKAEEKSEEKEKVEGSVAGLENFGSVENKKSRAEKVEECEMCSA
jgi:ribonucleoside-diphosphate reductase alpha subunit